MNRTIKDAAVKRSHAEGLIGRAESEPRIAGLRQPTGFA